VDRKDGLHFATSTAALLYSVSFFRKDFHEAITLIPLNLNDPSFDRAADSTLGLELFCDLFHGIRASGKTGYDGHSLAASTFGFSTYTDNSIIGWEGHK